MCFSSAAAYLSHDSHPIELLRSDSIFPKSWCFISTKPFLCNKEHFWIITTFPTKVLEVNPINKKEIKWSDYKKVPKLKVDWEQMVDSSDIIDKVYQRINSEKPISESEEEKNWHRSASEVLESFDYITSHGNFSFSERMVGKYAGASAIYFVSKKLKKQHHITNEPAALYEAAETWVDALKGRQYLGGSDINLADLVVFGVLIPIRHFKSGRDMVENTKIGEWHTRM